MSISGRNQRYVLKLSSTRLKQSGWNLTLRLSEARKKGEVVGLGESQLLRWLDELNGIENCEEKIGFTKIVWIMFTLASLLQWIWGSETCFISINMDFLGKNREIKQSIISLCVCLLYSMMGIGAALVGILCNKLGRIYTLNLSIYIYVIVTILCSLIPNSFLSHSLYV